MLKELIVPIGIVAIVATMLIPLPEVILNLLLVSNFILAILLLMSSIYVSAPLKLSVLPTLLLLTTLYRLALNISTTRMILSNASAGDVVKAFGSVVIQGNIVVGAVVFLIITLVQFLVVAKGAERVAEVSARFTLDALPGKQMSIDADVRSGLIDLDSARRKRDELQAESQFYGAIDGSMKFVKGDSIAGLAITCINVIGGLLIGVFLFDLDVSTALRQYTVLTVGDGLLSQIPALLNATAAGIVVTRVSQNQGGSLASDLFSQLTRLRQVQFLTAGVAIFLSFIPGFPFFPFAVLAAVVMISGLLAKEEDDQEVIHEATFKPNTPAVLQLSVESSMARFLHSSGNLADKVDRWRQEIYNKTGLAVNRIELGNNSILKGEYQILLRGVLVKTVEYQKLDDSTEGALWKNINDIVLSHKVELIDDMMTRRLLDYFDYEAPELVSSVVPGVITLTQLTEILKDLSKENIPIQHFDLILQAIAEHGSKVPSERALLQEVRVLMARVISSIHCRQDGKIYGYTIDPIIDLLLTRVEQETQELETSLLNYLMEELKDIEDNSIVLISKGSRRLLKECLSAKGMNIEVVAHEEIIDHDKFVSLGHISLREAEQNYYTEQLAA